jgi:hypothetical protein
VVLTDHARPLPAIDATGCFRQLMLVANFYDLLAKESIADLEPTRISDHKSGLMYLKSKDLYQICQQLIAEAPVNRTSQAQSGLRSVHLSECYWTSSTWMRSLSTRSNCT